MNQGIAREANLINTVLASRNVRARIAGRGEPQCYMTPATVVYALQLHPAQDCARLVAEADNLTAHIRRSRSVHGIGGPDATVRIDAMAHTIEVSRPSPGSLPFGTLQWQPAPCTALLGCTYTAQGARPLVWALADADTSNALVAGTTGSGKTNLLLAMVLSLAQHNSPDQLRLWIADMKPSPILTHLRDLPHVHMLAREPGDGAALIAGFRSEMQRRYDRRIDGVRHVLIVDELATLTEANRRLRDTVLEQLGEVGRKCREAGMNVIVTTQKPTAEVLGSQLKSNLALRLVGAVTSASDASNATNLAASGAERLPGHGAFLYRAGRTIVRFQAPLVDTRDWRQVRFAAHAAYGVRSAPIAQEVQPPTAEPPAPAEDGEVATARTMLARGASKNAICRALWNKPYAGGYTARLDKILAQMGSTTTSTTTTEAIRPEVGARNPVVVEEPFQVWY